MESRPYQFRLIWPVCGKGKCTSVPSDAEYIDIKIQGCCRMLGVVVLLALVLIIYSILLFADNKYKIKKTV